MNLTRIADKGLLKSSCVTSLKVTSFLLLAGYLSSMWLAHSGKLLLLLFLPVVPLLAMFGGSSPHAAIPAWLFFVLAFVAEFIGVFLVIHLIRAYRSGLARDA